MFEDSNEGVAALMLLLGFCLVVACVWMLRDALWAGLVAGFMLIYAAGAILRSED